MKINFNKLLGSLIFAAYGGLLLFLIMSGRINFFIHPGLQWLLIRVLGVFALVVLLLFWNALRKNKKVHEDQENLPWWKIVVLILPLLFGFLVKPTSLSSEQFWNRKGDDNNNLILSRQLSEAPKFVFNSENRTLEDWIRLIAQMPDDSQFVDQKVKLTGFVVKADDSAEPIFYISRYVLSCCAADARPIGLPVSYDVEKFQVNENEWLEVKGVLKLVEVEGVESLTVELQEMNRISEPDNPYITQ
ncbi:MAG: TIGR03943 family putative permease subunit [Candidatus Altimarinota bacterium]